MFIRYDTGEERVLLEIDGKTEELIIYEKIMNSFNMSLYNSNGDIKNAMDIAKEVNDVIESLITLKEENNIVRILADAKKTLLYATVQDFLDYLEKKFSSGDVFIEDEE